MHRLLKSLPDNAEYFRLITEQSFLGIYVLHDGFIVFANETFSELTGYSVPEILDWNQNEFLKIAHPDDSELMQNQYQKKISGENGCSTRYTFKAVSKHGKIKWLEVISKNLTLDGNIMILGTMIDVTKQINSEKALLASQEMYRKVLDNAMEAIFIVQNHQFKYFNSETLRLFRYSSDEFRRLHPTKTLHPEDVDLPFLKSMREEKIFAENEISPHRIITSDGQTRWVEMKVTTINWNDQSAFLIFLNNITEKKKSMEMMIQTEKIVSIGKLAAGMAHELNNPLGAILQSAQNILNRLSPDSSSNQRTAKETGVDLNQFAMYLKKRRILASLEAIRSSGRKAANIISSMLNFSRKSESRIMPVDIARLVENALELAGKSYNYKKRFDFRQIRINKEFAPDLSPVPCVKTEIEQVFLNLLNNAASALARNKSHEPPQITIRLFTEDNLARIEVEDNGQGIDPKIENKIFEPFFTTKPEDEGTGLGLSVAYMIVVNNHKGTMEVTSEIGIGTTFIIQLPLFKKNDSPGKT